jgi:hypothetical protein
MCSAQNDLYDKHVAAILMNDDTTDSDKPTKKRPHGDDTRQMVTLASVLPTLTKLRLIASIGYLSERTESTVAGDSNEHGLAQAGKLCVSRVISGS